MTKQFTLGKKERLKSRKQIEQLFKQGKSFALYPFKIYFVLSQLPISQHPEKLSDSPLRQGFGGQARLPLSLKLQGASPTPPFAKATGGKPDSRLPTPNSRLLFGVGAGTRNFKKAVDRNRIKRLTREAYRLQKNALHQKLLESGKQLNVFFIYTGKEIPDYSLISEKTTQILNRLLKIVDENNPMDT